MSAIRSTFLRQLIAADAAACGLSGALLVFDTAMLADLTGLTPQLMQPVGLFLIGYAVVLAILAARPSLPRAVVWTLVAVNLAWTVESLALVALGWAQPTTIGLVLIIAQAAAAALVGDLQFLALRRARREAMA